MYTYIKKLTAVTDIGGMVDTGSCAAVGVEVNDTEEPVKFGAGPCFNKICFFNCNSSKIFLFASSVKIIFD